MYIVYSHKLNNANGYALRLPEQSSYVQLLSVLNEPRNEQMIKKKKTGLYWVTTLNPGITVHSNLKHIFFFKIQKLLFVSPSKDIYRDLYILSNKTLLHSDSIAASMRFFEPNLAILIS